MEPSRTDREREQSERRCSRCRREKPTTEFYRDRSRKSGLNPRCKPCQRELTHAYQQTPEGRWSQERGHAAETRRKRAARLLRPSTERQEPPK